MDPRKFIRKTNTEDEDIDGKKELKDLQVFYISMVDAPAVPKAHYRLVKGEKMEELKKLLSSLSKQIAEYGEMFKSQQEQIDALKEDIAEDVSDEDPVDETDTDDAVEVGVTTEEVSDTLSQISDLLTQVKEDLSDEEVNQLSTIVETLLGEE